MKNLANCTPREFVKQTCRIKKSAERWLTATDILNIRKRQADMDPIEKGMDKAEAKETVARNIAKRDTQAMKNLNAMFDAIFEQHPEETLDLLALCCFVEPEDVDTHTMSEYLGEIAEMISNESVMSFFTSLARWGVLNTQN